MASTDGQEEKTLIDDEMSFNYVGDVMPSYSTHSSSFDHPLNFTDSSLNDETTTWTSMMDNGTTEPSMNIDLMFACKTILYSEMGTTRIRIWDWIILIQNLVFLIFLIFRCKPTRQRLKTRTRSSIFARSLYLLVCVDAIKCRSINSVSMTINDYNSIESIECQDPGYVDNAKRHGLQFLYRSNITYECDRGYKTIGAPFLLCKRDGTWNRDKPRCELIQCPPIRPVPFGIINYDEKERRVGAKIEVVCSPGYHLNYPEESSSYCEWHGNWSGSRNNKTLECILNHCIRPRRPHDGIRILGRIKEKFAPGENIIMRCEKTKTTVTATCLSDGSWNRGPPSCPEPLNKSCPKLSSFPNGYTNGSFNSNHSLGTRIIFKCNPKYLLEGPNRLVCESTGKWTGSIPSCALNLDLVSKSKFTSNSHFTIILVSIFCTSFLIILILLTFLIRWRQRQLQRRRWQRYFGNYNNRQSKMNITATSNQEMKLFRQSKGSPVPVTDL